MMEFVFVPRTVLPAIRREKPVVLEDKLASFQTKEEVWAWTDSLQASRKKIYILD